MDYILFGFGTGATLALGGWLFRDLGPRIRDRAPGEGDVLSAREMVSRMAWARFCAACGAALALAGIILMFATVGTALWNPTDDDGFRVVLITYGVITLLMLVWVGLFLRLFGASGIIRPREAKPATAKVETGTTGQSAQTGAGDAAGEGDAAPDARTFDEVASARGGLGRFAAFFRRDTPSDSAGETQVTEARTDTSRIGPMLPGEAETEDLREEASDEKRLSADDPLVTELMGEIPEERIVEPDLEADLVSELSMPGRDSVDAEDDNADSDFDEEPDANEDQPELSAEELALDQLRKKRLARLSERRNDE